LSKTNKAILSSIYPRVNFIDVESSSLFKLAADKFHSLHPYPMASVQDLSKFATLDSFEENVFYFSNFCLFMNDMSSIFQTEGDFIFSGNAELFYIKRDLNEFESLKSAVDDCKSLKIGNTYSFMCDMLKKLGQSKPVTGLVSNSEEFIDSKFFQLQVKLKRISCIYFNNLLSQETARKNSIVLSPNRSTS
jgi:hypothetical protein